MKLHLVYITLLVLCLEYSCDQARKLDFRVKGIPLKPATHVSTLLDAQKRGIVKCPDNSTRTCMNNSECCGFLILNTTDVEYDCCPGVCCGVDPLCCYSEDGTAECTDEGMCFRT